MKLITDILTWLQGNTLGERMITVSILRIVNHPISTPPSFLIHRTRSKMFYRLLDVLGIFLCTDEDAIRTRCNNSILQAIHIQRQLEFVDDMRILAMTSHHRITNAGMVQLISECIPGTQVLPFTIKRYYRYRFSLLRHLVVERDFWKFAISCTSIFKVLTLHILRTICII